MKKTALILVLLFVGALVFSSCRSQHQACAAYSQAEQPASNQPNS